MSRIRRWLALAALQFALGIFGVAAACASCPPSFTVPTIASDVDCVWRDYETDGAPGSGPHNPLKSDIRRWGETVGSIAAPRLLQTAVQSFPATAGGALYSQGSPDWSIFQTPNPYDPTEFQVYSNAAQGIATVTAGTNQVTLVSGTSFDATWVGNNYFYFEGTGYKVASVVDGSHLTVQTTGGGAVSWGATTNGTYFYVRNSATSVCNVSGTAVSWVSGQPFIGVWDKLTINGTPYTVSSYNSQISLTLSASAGTITGATCQQLWAGVSLISDLRVQTLAGSSEEGFGLFATPPGDRLQTFATGSGKYRPLYLITGEQPAGTAHALIGLHPSPTVGLPGYVALGGDSTIGNTVDFAIVSAAVGAVNIYTSGPSANSVLALYSKGNSPIYVGSPLQLPTFTVAALVVAFPCTSTIQYALAAVTDANAPTYNGTLTGGGSVKIPVFCNGSAWTAH